MVRIIFTNILKLKYLYIGILFFAIFYICIQLTFPRYFAYDDNVFMAMTYAYNYDVIINYWKIPIINFNQYMGISWQPGEVGVFFIPAYIAVFLSYIFFGNALHSIDILSFAFLLLAIVSMYFFLVKLSCKDYIAMIASVLWVTMPFVFTVGRSWIFIVYMAFWLPLNFLILIKLFEKPDLKLWILFALLRSMMLLNGYVPCFHMIFIFEILFLSLSLIVKKWFNLKFLLYFFASYVVTVLLTTVILLPMYNAAILSAERNNILSFAQITQYAMTLDTFVKAQMFEFSSWVFKAPGPQFYVGIPLLLIPLLLTNKNIKDNIDKRVLIVFSICLVSAFLLSTKFYGYLSFIPTFSLFRWPCKYYIFFAFFLVIIIALIWESASKSEIGLFRLLLPSAMAISIFINIGLIVYSGDLLKYGLKYEAPISFYLNLANKEDGRFFTAWVKNAPRYAAGKLLTGSFALQAGLYHFGGYDPLVSKINVENSLGLKYMSVYQNPPDEDLFKVLSEKGVKYIVTENSEKNIAMLGVYPFLNQVFADDEIIVFSNDNAMPIIYFSDMPDKAVDFKYNVNEINIYPLKSGELNISIAPIEGYKIYFDDKLVGIPERPPLMNFYDKYKTYEPVKIQIPENIKKVTLRYEDNHFKIGLMISCIILVTILLILVIFNYKNKKHNNLTQK